MAGRLTFSATVLSAFVFAAGAYGQSVISAKSGLIHYIEGDVAIDGKTVEMKTSQFPEIKEKQVLETAEGRAEVLLTPGVFLRLSENSSFRLLSNRLSDTQVEALTGSILLEHGEITKDTLVTLIYKDRNITFVKSGLYRLDADKGAFRVYQGEARINGADQTLTAKAAREVELNAPVLLANKFDNKVGDEFYRWASRRASYMALANISGAKALRDSGMRLTSGSWYWNPWFGMFTYVPFGSYYSPFGYHFYNPSRVMQFYQPRVYAGSPGGGWSGGGGYGGGRFDSSSGYNMGSHGSMGSSGSMSSGASAGSVGNSSAGSSSGSSGGSVGSSAPSGGGRGR